MNGCVSPLRVRDQRGRARKKQNETRRMGSMETLFWGKICHIAAGQSGQMKGEEEEREMKNGERKKTND